MNPEELLSSLRVVDRLTEEQKQQLHVLYQGEWWTRGRTLEQTHALPSEATAVGHQAF